MLGGPTEVGPFPSLPVARFGAHGLGAGAEARFISWDPNASAEAPLFHVTTPPYDAAALASFRLGVGGSTILMTRRLPRAWVARETAARETAARETAVFSGSSRRSSWDRTSGEKQVPPRSALRRHVSE
jgi:hypothetical protein